MVTRMTMDDIEAEVQRMVQAECEARGQLTLRVLFNALYRVEPRKPVRWLSGGSPGEPFSYRGHYDHLAFPTLERVVLVEEMLRWCAAANGQTFHGYKGGDFTMHNGTPVWRGEWGQWVGSAPIIGVQDTAPVALIVLGPEEG